MQPRRQRASSRNKVTLRSVRGYAGHCYRRSVVSRHFFNTTGKETSTMSYRAEVVTKGEGDWVSNRVRFATRQEATDYIHDLAQRWTWVTATRVTESFDPVNYRYLDNQLYAVVPYKWPLPSD